MRLSTVLIILACNEESKEPTEVVEQMEPSSEEPCSPDVYYMDSDADGNVWVEFRKLGVTMLAERFGVPAGH